MSMEAYQAKLPLLSSIPDDQVLSPSTPIQIIVQEAENLAYWAKQDQQQLAATNLDITLIDDLTVRAAACREAESIWTAERFTKDEAQREWKAQMETAHELRNKIQRAMDYAFRNYPDLLGRLQTIREGSGSEDFIQDLNDLSILGNQNSVLLNAINFQIELLSKAAETSSMMAGLLASATSSKISVNQAKNMRDRAYTHLREAMTEIRLCGQYVFADNKERLQGYISTYRHTHRRKSTATNKETITA